MHEGMILRLRHIFSKDGRAVVVAADHGAIAGPLPGIESPADLALLCAQGGADALLVHKGFLRAALPNWSRELGIILRESGGFTTLGGKFEEQLIGTAKDAVFWDADASAITVKFGHEHEGEVIRHAASLISECEQFSIPVMIEAIPFLDGAQSWDPEALAVATRAAEELGASFIKAPLPLRPKDLSKVLRGSHVPVLILGGEKLDSLEALFTGVAQSLECGAAGVAMGRNIWGQNDAVGVLEAIVGIVHEGWGVDNALAHLKTRA